MNDENLYDLVKTYFDRLENRLISIEDRLRDVENHISESKVKPPDWSQLKTFLFCYVVSLRWYSHLSGLRRIRNTRLFRNFLR